MGVDQFVTELKNLEALLDDPALEPDPKRPDWPRHAAHLDRLKATAGGVIDRAQAPELVAELADDQRRAMHRAAAIIPAEAAAVLQASGDRPNAGALLARARDLAPDG